MADNGIKIGIGFTDSWKAEIGKVQAELSKIDFGKSINIEESLKQQLGGIRRIITDFSNEANKSNAVEMFSRLSTEVESVTSDIQKLTKIVSAMGGDTSGLVKMGKDFNNVGKQMKDAVTTINDFQKQSGKKIELVDTSALKEIENFIKLFKSGIGNAIDLDDNYLSGFKSVEDKVKEIMRLFEQFKEKSSLIYDDISKNNAIDMSNAVIEVLKLSDAMSELAFSLSDSDLKKNGINSIIDRTVDTYDDAIARSKELIPVLSQLKKELASTAVETKETVGDSSKVKALKIPLQLSDRAESSLTKQTIKVIEGVTEKVANKPIEVEVQLVSAYQSWGNKKILNDIEAELNKLGDGEVSGKLQGLIDKMNKRVENAVLLNIDLNVDTAEKQLRDFIKTLKTDLNDAKDEVSHMSDWVNGISISEESVMSLTSLIALLSDCLSKVDKLEKSITTFDAGIAEARQRISDYVTATSYLFQMFDDKVSEASGNLSKNLDININFDSQESAIVKIKELQEAVEQLANTEGLGSIIDEASVNKLVLFVRLLSDGVKNIKQLMADLTSFDTSVGEARQRISDYITATSRLFIMFDDKLAEARDNLDKSLNINIELKSEEDVFAKLKQLQDVLDSLSTYTGISLGKDSITGLKTTVKSLADCVNNLKKLEKELAKVDTSVSNSRKKISDYVTATSRLFQMFEDKLVEARTGIDKVFDAKVKLTPDSEGFATDLVNQLKDVKIPISVYFADVDMEKSAKALKVPINNLTKDNKDAEKKAQKEATDLAGLEKASKLLDKYENSFRKKAESFIDEKEYQILEQSMTAQKNGWVEIKTLIEDADGAHKEYTAHAVSARKVINDKNTIAETKRAIALSKELRKLQEASDSEKILTENGGWIGEVSITDTDKWQRVLDLAERFEVEMKDIGKVMQQVDKDGKESFRFFSKDGSTVTTLGQDSKQILYLSKVLGDSTKLINDYEKSITKVSSAFKGAFKGDDVSVGKFTDSLQKMFDLYSKIQGIKDSKLVSKEDLDRIKQIEQRLKNVLADTVNPHTIEDKLEGSMPDYIDRVKESANGLRGIFEQIFSTHVVSNAEELTSAIKNFGTVLLDAKDDANKLAKDTKIVNMIKTIETELNKNSAMLPEHKKRYQDLLTTLRNAFDGTEKASKESIQGILVQLMKLQSEVQATGKTGLNFLDRLKKAISTNLVQYIARFLSIQDIIRYVRTISSTIVDLDTALVDLKKTTAMDADQLESFYTESTNVAKSMGVSTKQIIEQAAAWSRLGYNTEEASTKMAELSSKFKAISPGMDLENATDGLVSTMQANMMCLCA